MTTLCLGFGVDSANAQETEIMTDADKEAKTTVVGTPTGFAGEMPDILNLINEEGSSVQWQQIDEQTAQQYTWHENRSASDTNYTTDQSGENLINATGAIKVENPNSETQYYSYIYTKPENYIKITGINSDSIENAYFYNGSNSNSGVATVWNRNMDLLHSDFISNDVKHGAWGWGGAITVAKGDWWASYASVQDVNGNFINNTASDFRTAGITAQYNSTIENISGNFINNIAKFDNGGVIRIEQTYVNSIKGNFVGNSIDGSYGLGGCIALDTGNEENKVNNILGNFISNSIYSTTGKAFGGAVGVTHWGSAFSYLNNMTGNFINNKVLTISGDARGGGFYNNYGIIGTIDDESKLTGGIVNSKFYGNYAKSGTGTAQGGAIWTNKDLNVIADNGTSTFKDNFVQVGEGEKDYQAIWVEGTDKNLNLQQYNNGEMYMYDNINGSDGYTVNIEGDGTGTMYLFNDIKNANVTFNNTTVNAVNNDAHTYNFDSFTLNGDTNFVADVDLVNESMDRISADSYGEHTGTLTVTGINLLNDADKDNTKILFADEGLADNVDTTVTTVSYSPIYKYNVSYNRDEEDNRGYFSFARSSTGGSEDYNPAVIVTPVSTQAAAQVSMMNTFTYANTGTDSFMSTPLSQRTALRMRNRYALSESELNDGANPLHQLRETSSAWLKPYASFENIPLKHGPKVNVISYGSLAGYDSDLKEMKRGWLRNWTGFVGYNGASSHFSNVDAYQNGGLIGGTLNLYKNNFFNTTTITTGAMVGENHTMYGTDTTTSIMAGIGNKTGYNIEFKQGKFIIQPSVFLAYTMVKTLDYTNKAGVRIDSDPAHTLQISPGVKFIANLKHGWQPYLGVNMVWNALSDAKVKADAVTLPNMYVKPYILYGLGVQKTVKDNFTAYGQAMVQNGGRNGVSLTAGFRWAVGKGSAPAEKVQNEDKEIPKQVNNNKIEIQNKDITANEKPKTSLAEIKFQPKEINEKTLKGKIDMLFAKMNGEPYEVTTRTGKVAVIEKL